MFKTNFRKECESIKDFLKGIAKPLTLIIIFFISAPYVTPNFITKYNLETPYIILFGVLILYLVKCALQDKSKNKLSEKRKDREY